MVTVTVMVIVIVIVIVILILIVIVRTRTRAGPGRRATEAPPAPVQQTRQATELNSSSFESHHFSRLIKLVCLGELT